MTKYFELIHIRDSLKVTILIAVSTLLYAFESYLDNRGSVLAVSGLLAVMTMCITINHLREPVAIRLAIKFSKLWVAAEIFLFVLVGATVNIDYALQAGLPMIGMLLIGLVFRLLGTRISVIGTGLNRGETIFCLISQIPKATVQAAIGGIPLAMGLACGETVLTMAVVSIVITAPLGAIGMDLTAYRFLSKDD